MTDMDTRKVTIILPTYNRRDSLRGCLQALLACEVEGMQVDLRVVDDGSQDGTGEMIKGIEADPTGAIRMYYHRQENSGASAARNRGIRAANTDILLFIDDDCLPEPGWVRSLASGPWAPDTGAVA